MEVENSSSALHKTNSSAQTQTYDETLDRHNNAANHTHPINEMDQQQLVGAPVNFSGDCFVGGGSVSVEVVKRKRGRPPRGQLKAVTQPPAEKRKKEEEDVCFICFDGGTLVLCDRKSCPKAYHPACIKRDEAFFKSKARWDCGWHICSVCHKASHYMCYTCTYSLCKGCVKRADYFCVRGNKGFCPTCMRMVMLIENNEQGNKEMVQVDFDDQSSWEYLFKVYWIYLKESLSLTLNELTQAKNPRKGADKTCSRGQSCDVPYNSNDSKSSISGKSSEHLGVNGFKINKTAEQLELLYKDSLSAEKSGFKIVDIVARRVEADGNNENLLSIIKDETCKTHVKSEPKETHSKLNEYAAIDVHNINLIFLRRSLIECLIENNEKFHDKVVSSIVRIRIYSSDQKQDMYRLVQVVGTRKVAVPYKLGDRTVDVMLEILNLDKKETILIDAISNEEFSEEECKGLRQSIKFGFVKRFTVGEVKEKAMALQAVRPNDWLETEISRFNHLHDRASEKGHKKEPQECIEELQLLKMPEERQHRLNEIPEVHADPRMDPNYESEEDAGETKDGKQDEHLRPRYSEFFTNGNQPTSPRNRGEVSHNTDGASKNLTTCDLISNECHPAQRLSEEKDACGSNSLQRSGNQVDLNGSVLTGNQTVMSSQLISGVASETSLVPLCTENAPSVMNGELDKLWHYRDPNGGIQGPFSIVELRKWSTTGFFPPDMRIWVRDEQVDYVLLTDALNGQFHKALQMLYNPSFQSQVVGGTPDSKLSRSDVGWNESMNPIGRGNHHSKGSNAGVLSNNDNYVAARSDDQSSHSRDSTTPVNCKEIQAGTCLQLWDSLKGKNGCSDQPLERNPLTSPVLPGQPYVSLSHHESGQEGKRENSGLNNNNDWNFRGTTLCQITDGNSRENQCNSQTNSGQSCGQNWRNLPGNVLSNNLDSKFAFASVTKSTDSSEQNGDVDIANLPILTLKTSSSEAEVHAAENLLSLSSDVHVQNVSDLRRPTPKPSHKDQKGQAADTKQSMPSNFPVQDSGPSWSSASSLVVGGPQLPEVADEWGGYSSAAKTSAEEWDPGLVSVFSLKPPGLVTDHVATPTSMTDQFIHSSTSHPGSNVSNWQAFRTEPIEFTTLAEESVSDLLAEVDAMESQSGLASATSAMNRGEVLIQGSRNRFFSSIEELSPTPDPGRSDALSSTADIQLPCHSTMTSDTVRAFQLDFFDSVNRSSGQSPTSDEVEGQTNATHVPFNRGKSGSGFQPPAPSTMSQHMVGTGIAQSACSEAMNTGWGTMHGNVNLVWGESTQGMANIGWNIGQGTAWGSADTNHSAMAGSQVLDSQRRYSGERFPGPRETAFQGDSGYNRGLPSSHKQSFGGGGGGGYSRQPTKGQRVCKFNESGHCRKGAFCEYLHS